MQTLSDCFFLICQLIRSYGQFASVFLDQDPTNFKKKKVDPDLKAENMDPNRIQFHKTASNQPITD